MAKITKHNKSTSKWGFLQPLFSIPPPWLTIGWLLVATILFLLPGDDLPDQDVSINHFDKLIHAILFGGIIVLAARDVIRQSKSVRYLIFFLLSLSILLFFYGHAIEHLQETYLNRDGNIPDLIADMVGVGLGLILILIFHKRFRKA